MHEYTRAYETQLISFREERTRTEEAGYREHVKVTVSSLIARGENVQHISSILEVPEATCTGWYRDLFLNQQDMVFDIESFTYIREMNKIRADARTKGCIVKSILDGRLTEVTAAEAIGGIAPQTIRNWINSYSRDCEIMMTLPAGVEYTIKTPYAYCTVDAENIQTVIFNHDREENELASRLREEHITGRG